jgi:prevent-host-death family protein
MKTVSATEVARNLSEVLDGVEHRHQTYLVTRGGKPIARITPVPSANGLEVKRLLRDHAADPSWPDELAMLRAGLAAEGRDRLIVVTTDRGGFADLPGVSVRPVAGSAPER